MTLADVRALVARLAAGFPALSADHPFQIQSTLCVTAIGGPTCLFRMAEIATGGARKVGAGDVWRAIEAQCGSSDEALRARGFPQEEMLLPKLALLVAVLEHLFPTGTTYTYEPCIGSCPGILAANEYWPGLNHL